MMLLLCVFVQIVCVMTVCVMMLLRYDVRESPRPSLFSRPFCTVAESTSGLAAVCLTSETVSVVSPVVSPAQPSNCPVVSRATSVKSQVTAPSVRPFAAPPPARPVASSATHICQVAATTVASSFPSVRPVVDSPFRLSSSLGALRSPFCPPFFALARFVVLLPVLGPCQFGFVLSFLPTLC